jgi:hypothetical protein
VGFNQFGFSEPKENYGFSHVADAQRLVIMIQDEHLTTKFAICANSSGFCAEDSVPSFHYITELAQIFLEEYLGITLKI